MHRITILLSMVAFVTSCGGSQLDDADEIGHAAADVFASLDETGQGGGFARLQLRRPELERGTLFDRTLDALLPAAYAASCWSVTFDACNAGVRSKDLANCTIGLAQLSGTVTLTFSDVACSLASVDSSVTREADFTLTGRRGATLTVSSEGGGQQVTRTADGWSYRVNGMHRVMTGPAGATLFDIETKTQEDLAVTGTSRSDRVVNGGKLEVRHNLAKYTTVLTPESLTWSPTCNCPVSGKLTGTATPDEGEATTAVIEISGCGAGTITLGEESQAVTFDRCSGV